jgi:hypothetical protein
MVELDFKALIRRKNDYNTKRNAYENQNSNIQKFMNWKAYENKNLLVPDRDNFEFKGKKYRKVILNPKLDSALCAIDKYWPPESEVVTSGVRTPEDSLRIIRTYLKKKDLARFYPEAMTCGINDKDEDLYVWQTAWSHLLSLKVIINPPLPAKCLMDYYRNGKNRKGQTIGQSPHTRGTAIDLSGIDSEVIVKRLVEDGMIRSYLVERENNCIHIDV